MFKVKKGCGIALIYDIEFNFETNMCARALIEFAIPNLILIYFVCQKILYLLNVNHSKKTFEIVRVCTQSYFVVNNC